MDYNFELFNAITVALEVLDFARAALITAQKNAEEIYISSEDQPMASQPSE